MSGDYLLREQFVTDPVGVVNEYLHGRRLGEEEAGDANHLVYAAMANAELVGWFREYAARRHGDTVTTAEFLEDFAVAVVECGASDVVRSLSRCAAPGRGLTGLDEEILDYLLVVGAQVPTGTDVPPDALTGTDAGTHTGTTTATGTHTPPVTDTGTHSGTHTGTHTPPVTDTGTHSGTHTGTHTPPVTDTGTHTGTMTPPVTDTGTQHTFTGITLNTFITQVTTTGHTDPGGTFTNPFTNSHTDPFTKSPFTTPGGTHHVITQDNWGDLDLEHVLTSLEALHRYSVGLKESGALAAYE
jgi:hypothetical protein